MILIEKVTHKGALLGYNTEGDLVARECSTCKELLPVSSFGKNKFFVGGVQCECMGCVSVTRKKNYHNRKSGNKNRKVKLDSQGVVLGRVCTKCKTYQSKQNFGIQTHKANKYGISCICKSCAAENRKIRTENGKAREAWLKHTYGISQDTYNIMLQNQNGSCSICKGTVPNTFTANKNLLVVDHCHTTGKVRSLLCSTCNVTLGKFETYYNEESSKKFFDYLEFCKKIKDSHE